MKISITRLSLALLVIATVIPSYWFVTGRQLLNLMYLLATFLVLVRCFINPRIKISIRYGWALIYIISLAIYSIQAAVDAKLMTGINYFLSTVIVIIIVANSVRYEIDFYKVLDGLLYVTVPLLFVGIIESVTGFNIFQKAFFTIADASFYTEVRLGIYRIATVFGHPIVYCNFLSIIAALLIYRLSCQLTRKQRIRFELLYVLTVLNLLLTVSRSVILVFIAEQAILLAIKRERWLTRRKLNLFLIAVLALLISEMCGFGLLDKIGDLVNMILQVFGLGSDSYSSEFSSIGYSGVEGDRWNLYIWVLDSLVGNLWFGKGTNAEFSYMATEYREKTSIENYYLSTLFHHGIFGVIVLLVGLFGIGVYIIKKIRENKKLDKKTSLENRLTYNKVFLIILVGEIVSYFMVDQSGEARLLYVCIGLALAYNGLVICHKNVNGDENI